jgi:2-polyprenyl-3-methyl-5-hydroxy-6-metoxy-1,4-benzoquinol methylase
MSYRLDPTDQEFTALMKCVGTFAGKRVLEVGCGNGRLTRKYAHLAAHVDAIDPDADKITQALAKPHPDHTHYHTAALETFTPPTPQPYNLAILSWSL